MAFRCFAQQPDLTDRCSTFTPLRRQDSGLGSFSVQLSDALGNDTVGLHHSREPQIQEVRLFIRPWNQRRNRYISGLTVTNETKSRVLVVRQQSPTMRRKTQRIIGKVLTWAVELLPLERSSCKTENTALLRRCSQLRREEQGS